MTMANEQTNPGKRVVRKSDGGKLNAGHVDDAPKCPFCGAPVGSSGDCGANCIASRRARHVRKG